MQYVGAIHEFRLQVLCRNLFLELFRHPPSMGEGMGEGYFRVNTIRIVKHLSRISIYLKFLRPFTLFPPPPFFFSLKYKKNKKTFHKNFIFFKFPKAFPPFPPFFWFVFGGNPTNGGGEQGE